MLISTRRGRAHGAAACYRSVMTSRAWALPPIAQVSPSDRLMLRSRGVSGVSCLRMGVAALQGMGQLRTYIGDEARRAHPPDMRKSREFVEFDWSTCGWAHLTTKH